MKRRGRPPKTVQEKRQERLDLRVSSAEKQAFKLAAEKSEQELSVWIRIQLHKAAGDELLPIKTSRNSADGATNVEYGESSADRASFV